MSIAHIKSPNEMYWDNLGKRNKMEKGISSSHQEECSFVSPAMMAET